MSTDITAALALEFSGKNPPSRGSAKSFVRLEPPNSVAQTARDRQFFGDPRPFKKSDSMKRADARLERIRFWATQMDELPF